MDSRERDGFIENKTFSELVQGGLQDVLCDRVRELYKVARGEGQFLGPCPHCQSPLADFRASIELLDGYPEGPSIEQPSKVPKPVIEISCSTICNGTPGLAANFHESVTYVETLKQAELVNLRESVPVEASGRADTGETDHAQHSGGYHAGGQEIEESKSEHRANQGSTPNPHQHLYLEHKCPNTIETTIQLTILESMVSIGQLLKLLHENEDAAFRSLTQTPKIAEWFHSKQLPADTVIQAKVQLSSAKMYGALLQALYQLPIGIENSYYMTYWVTKSTKKILPLYCNIQGNTWLFKEELEKFPWNIHSGVLHQADEDTPSKAITRAGTTTKDSFVGSQQTEVGIKREPESRIEDVVAAVMEDRDPTKSGGNRDDPTKRPRLD